MFTIEIPDGTWGGFGRVVRLPDIAELVLGPEMRAPAEEWLAVNTSQPEAIGRGGGCPFELFTRAHAPTAVSACTARSTSAHALHTPTDSAVTVIEQLSRLVDEDHRGVVDGLIRVQRVCRI